MAPNYLSREDVPADLVESERRIAEETAKALEGVPPAYVEKYFVPTQNGFCVHKDLRRCVIFGRHDCSRTRRSPAWTCSRAATR